MSRVLPCACLCATGLGSPMDGNGQDVRALILSPIAYLQQGSKLCWLCLSPVITIVMHSSFSHTVRSAHSDIGNVGKQRPARVQPACSSFVNATIRAARVGRCVNVAVAGTPYSYRRYLSLLLFPFPYKPVFRPQQVKINTIYKYGVPDHQLFDRGPASPDRFRQAESAEKHGSFLLRIAYRLFQLSRRLGKMTSQRSDQANIHGRAGSNNSLALLCFYYPSPPCCTEQGPSPKYIQITRPGWRQNTILVRHIQAFPIRRSWNRTFQIRMGLRSVTKGQKPISHPMVASISHIFPRVAGLALGHIRAYASKLVIDRRVYL